MFQFSQGTYNGCESIHLKSTLGYAKAVIHLNKVRRQLNFKMILLDYCLIVLMSQLYRLIRNYDLKKIQNPLNSEELTISIITQIELIKGIAKAFRNLEQHSVMKIKNW